ncbi:MAG: sugar ABC transporter ATP-binding protein [Lactovum sp.]
MKIEMKEISKSFGKNKVLESLDFTINSAEVHALMGENGAGKSTLMNILTGLFPATTGKIEIDDVEISFDNPQEAEEFGISFIHQEMNTWPEMTVLENLFIGRQITTKLGLLDNKAMKAKAIEVFQRLSVDIPLDMEIGRLSVGQQQLVEIAKSFLTKLEILIMDEPTAALTERETEKLFELIAQLKNQGVGIIYISHRMEEIFKITDKVTVMRDGLVIDTKETAKTNKDELVKLMVGRELTDYYPKKVAKINDTVFEVENLKAKAFENISFSVKSGEILGFAGLMGAGRTEVMRAIFSIDKLKSGKIKLNGEEIKIQSPSDAICYGMGFLTEDRKEEGLILDFTIKDNITLASNKDFNHKGLFDEKTATKFVLQLIERLRIKCTAETQSVSDLSGGNQQKVVLAKWIGIAPKLLILDEPTRGVDVGAKREIYQLINELAERGVPIIMVSSDLPEILGVSDRIVVMHEGKITGILNKEEATQEKIMTLATAG